MVGTSIGPYCVVGKLGAGGMGEVYLADDPRLNRKVALKTVSSTSLVTGDARKNLLREARAVAQLSHPNIAAVYDVLDYPDGLHIVMEYVEGETGAELARNRVPVEKVVNIGLQLMDALAHAHAHGILHRDIKPSNIAVTADGRVKVLDFGLAKAWDQTTRDIQRSSETGIVMGTPGYMAPERLLCAGADHRADLYSAGALLYELLTGRLPFEETGYAALTLRVMTETPTPPHNLNPRVPDELSAVVMRALSRDAHSRQQSASEMRDELARIDRAFGESKTDETPQFFSGSGRGEGHRRRVVRWTAAAAALIAIVAGVWFAWSIASGPVPAEAFAARDWVLIADFENQTNEPLFDYTLRATLEMALQQSAYVNVLPRRQVFDGLRRMKRANVSKVNELDALDVGRRENVKVVLAGSVLSAGTTFQLSVRATETATGGVLFVETKQFNRKEDLFDKVDEIAVAVRKNLGEWAQRMEQQPRPLAKVTTGSLEALQLYTRGSDALARGALEESRDLLEAALRIDRDFPMAHVRLGAVYTSLGQFKKTMDHYSRAYELRAQVTERELHLIESKYYEVRDEYEKARDSWRVLAQLYPDDMTARLELAIALYESGEFEASVPEFRHVLTLDPFNGSANARLVLALARIGRPDDAIAAAKEAAARKVENPFLLWGLGLAHLGRNENDLARRTFSELGQSGDIYRSLSGLYAAQADSAEGRMAAARRRLESGLALDRKLQYIANELIRRYFLGRLHVMQGDNHLADRQAREILAAGEENLIAQNLLQAGTLFARVGNVSAARGVVARLERVHNKMPSSFHRTLLEIVRGELALHSGQLQAAARDFQSAADGYPTYEAHAGLATVHARLSEWAQSREAWTRVIAQRGNILQVGFAADWALAHLELARVCRQSGDDACAKLQYEKFLTLWQQGDDLPVRRKAQDELNALVRAAPGRR